MVGKEHFKSKPRFPDFFSLRRMGSDTSEFVVTVHDAYQTRAGLTKLSNNLFFLIPGEGGGRKVKLNIPPPPPDPVLLYSSDVYFQFCFPADTEHSHRLLSSLTNMR